MKFKFKNNFWKGLACTVFNGFWIYYYWAIIVKYTAYPWWHRIENDIDATHVATTLSLINNSELTFVYHPAATIFLIHGFIYKILGFAFHPFYSFIHLPQIQSFEEALNVLQSASVVSRVIVLFTVLLFSIVLFLVLLKMTRNTFCAFFFSFFICTTSGLLSHVTMIRPELLTLLFFYLSLYVFLSGLEKLYTSEKKCVAVFLTIGVLFGFSVLSKIQIVPVIGASFMVMMFCVYKGISQKGQDIEPNAIRKTCLWISLVNLILCPWWALIRPDYLSDEFLSALDARSDLWLVYGAAPKSLIIPVLILFLSLSVLSALYFKKNYSQQRLKPLARFNIVLCGMNAILTGMIVSAYTVLMPVSGSFSRYIENTQHLIYATITNISYAGYLSQPAVQDEGFVLLSFETLSRLFDRLSWGNILNIHLGYFIVLVAVFCCIRMIQKRGEERMRYGVVLLWFITAFIMDVLAIIRDPFYKAYYFIYTITLYGTGLAVWVSLEWKALSVMKDNKWIAQVVKGLIVCIFALHIVFKCNLFLNMQKATGQSHQNPMIEWEYMQPHTQPFWKIIYESLRQHSS